MRILITNDDGISAPGLEVIHEIATEIAGPSGEVVTVAPAFEQSGVGHCMSYIRPMRLEELGPARFAVEGSPADCVMAGLHVMQDNPPNLILSGVNRGHNVAEDTLYSGTIGAAMEGALQRVRAIAMSQYFGPENAKTEDPFAAARTFGPRVVRALIENANWNTDSNYGLFYNVNFPPLQPENVKGIKATVQGERPQPPFTVEPHTSPNRRTYLWIKGRGGNEGSPQGSDAREAYEGHVTVTPLRADLTAQGELQHLEGIIEGLEGQS